MPVRAASIRGQLRYWWRATRRDLSLSDLRLLEEALFGGVHGGPPTASSIAVAIKKPPAPPHRKEIFKQGDAFKLVDDKLGNLAYGAFPLRGTDVAKTHDVLWNFGDSSFTIELRIVGTDLSKAILVRSELEQALWAWLHFGGLGGRTRRGFGAIQLVSSKGFELRSIEDGWPKPKKDNKLEREKHGNPGWAVLPQRHDAVVRAAPKRSGVDAQDVLLGLLREMRQGDLGRNKGNGSPRPGRSFWSEPSAIRKLTRYEGGPHGKPIPDPLVPKFPRGAFGAPIIFHFKTGPGEREPRDTTLVPAPDGKSTYERFASSLVLRPHVEKDGRIVPMAVRLEHPRPAHWRLTGRELPNPPVVTIDLEDAERARLQPFANHPAAKDAVDLYLARLANK
jgi:CRISPR-associated protein Cmr1